MEAVKRGDTVKVHYHGKLTDGTTFDSSEGREPLSFVAGSGQVIMGFDNAVIGMEPGEKKTVNIPVMEAYGDRQENMVLTFPVSDFPEGKTPEVGMEMQMSDNQGNIFAVVITEINGDMMKLDANHPLAGMDLVFDLELVAIG